MGAVQSTGFSGIETLFQVIRRKEVQVTDLRTFDTHNPQEMPGRDIDTCGVARRDHLLID